MREITGIGSVGNISKGKVIQYARYLSAMNFNSLSSLLSDRKGVDAFLQEIVRKRIMLAIMRMTS